MRSLRAFAFTPSIKPWYPRNGGTGRVATIATYKVPKVENENNVGKLTKDELMLRHACRNTI
jgi:hypothetical protein